MSCLFCTQRFFFCLFSANYKLGTLPRQQTPQNDCKYAANVTKMVCYLHLAASIASLRINFKLVAIMCGICSTELFKRHGTLLKKLKSRQKKNEIMYILCLPCRHVFCVFVKLTRASC